MFFNVSQLLRERSGSARKYDIDESFIVTDDKQVRRVSGKVNMLRTDRGIWVSARLETNMPCTCSRCLEWYEQPVNMAIEEEFFHLVNPNTGTKVHREEEAIESLLIDQNHTLDLREAAREYSLLGLPMKPVCREDCAGICPMCGENLNEAVCRCEEAPRDSRWGPLLRIASADGNDI